MGKNLEPNRFFIALHSLGLMTLNLSSSTNSARSSPSWGVRAALSASCNLPKSAKKLLAQDHSRELVHLVRDLVHHLLALVDQADQVFGGLLQVLLLVAQARLLLRLVLTISLRLRVGGRLRRALGALLLLLRFGGLDVLGVAALAGHGAGSVEASSMPGTVTLMSAQPASPCGLFSTSASVTDSKGMPFTHAYLRLALSWKVSVSKLALESHCSTTSRHSSAWVELESFSTRR